MNKSIRNLEAQTAYSKAEWNSRKGDDFRSANQYFQRPAS
jgi:hypothetical protein